MALLTFICNHVISHKRRIVIILLPVLSIAIRRVQNFNACRIILWDIVVSHFMWPIPVWILSVKVEIPAFTHYTYYFILSIARFCCGRCPNNYFVIKMRSIFLQIFVEISINKKKDSSKRKENKSSSSHQKEKKDKSSSYKPHRKVECKEFPLWGVFPLC